MNLINLFGFLPTVITLFCGAGGSSLGLLTAGFRELLAIDNDTVVEENFRLNFSGQRYVPFLNGDLWKMTADDIMSAALLPAKGMLDLLVITAPCQGFSVASGKADCLDFRNGLFLKSISIAAGIQSKVIIWENVPGMMSPLLTPIFNEIKYRFIEELPNYTVYCFKVNALFFGVPSARERLIFIAIREDVFKSYPVFIPSTPDIDRFKIKNIAPEIEMISFGQSKKIIHFPNQFMPTITATEGIKIFLNGVWQSLSEREDYLKMFSSFPADFQLVGTDVQKHRLIGNAVPPALMYHLAYFIKHTILGYPEEPTTLMLPAAA